MKKAFFSTKVLLLHIALVSIISATAYYVNSSGSNGNGSINSPFNTLSSIPSALVAGDTVYFAKGSSFTGSRIISSSGTAQKPIVFTSYGTGNAPKFRNSSASLNTGAAFVVSGDYVRIENLYIYDCAIPGAAQGDCNNILEGIGAINIKTGADYCVVKNCEIVNSPIGVHIRGQHGLITQCYIHDMNNAMCGDAWGPIAVFVGNAYNEISWNRFINYKRVGGAFGADGGAIELDDQNQNTSNCHHISIHHNISLRNEGFLEVTYGGDSINVCYNLSFDYQQFIFWWAGRNSLVANNTVICTLPTNNGDGHTGVVGGTNIAYKNNIFVVGTGINFCGEPDDLCSTPSIATNNLYWSADNSVKTPNGWPMTSSEFIADPQFVRHVLNDTINNDFRLKSTSPAIGKGTPIGFNVDLDGTTVPTSGKVDLGAFQYKSVNNLIPQNNVKTVKFHKRQSEKYFDITGKAISTSKHKSSSLGIYLTSTGEKNFSLQRAK